MREEIAQPANALPSTSSALPAEGMKTKGSVKFFSHKVSSANKKEMRFTYDRTCFLKSNFPRRRSNFSRFTSFFEMHWSFVYTFDLILFLKWF